MNILWIQAFVLMLCLLSAGIAFASGGKKLYKSPGNERMNNADYDGSGNFLSERLNQVFPSLGYLRTIDNCVYDFDQTGRCRVIDFGFSANASSRVQLPHFISLSNDSRYADVDFIYISFDDVATIRKDIHSLTDCKYDKLIIFSVDKAYFMQSEKPLLACGCPTIYFVDRNGIVKAIANGGNSTADEHTESHLKATWRACIESLLT